MERPRIYQNGFETQEANDTFSQRLYQAQEDLHFFLPDKAYASAIPVPDEESFATYKHFSDLSAESPSICERVSHLLANTSDDLQKCLRTKNFYDLMHPSDTRFGRGPHTKTVLKAAEQHDPYSLLFGLKYQHVIRAMDTSYFLLRGFVPPALPHKPNSNGYNEEHLAPALSTFEEISEDIWQTVSDTDDPSRFRNFVLEHFETVYLGSLLVGDNPENYHTYAVKSYERMKTIVEENPSYDFSFLAEYLSRTNILQTGVSLSEEFDSELKSGNSKRYQEYAALEYQISKEKVQFDENPSKDIVKNVKDYWLGKFKSGEIDLDSLVRVVNYADEMEEPVDEFLHTFDSEALTYGKRELCEVLKTHSFFHGHSETVRLLNKGILPTEDLIDFLKDHPADGIDYFHEAEKQTQDGEFDPANKIQVSLEFGNYLRSISEGTEYMNYGYFSQLPYVDENMRGPDLTGYQCSEADATAYEAAHAYWLVREFADAGRESLVVGNPRYGSHFVTEPLRWHLEKVKGVTYVDASSTKVSSTDTSPNTIPEKIFPDHITNQVINGGKDIIIFDGTSTSFEYVANCPRLPKSMLGYLNWFLTLNEAMENDDPQFPEQLQKVYDEESFYKLSQDLYELRPTIPYSIRMWSPMADENTESISLGNIVFPLRRHDVSDNTQQVVLASPCIHPQHVASFPQQWGNHRPGFFDDPNRLVETNHKDVFTQFGYRANMSEELFVRRVQEQMEAVLPEMILCTDPVLVFSHQSGEIV